LQLVYLETDASLDTRREVVGLDGRLFPAGGGIILRDITLRPLLLKSVNLGYVPNPLHAEYLAFVYGLEEAVSLGARGVWATTDNLPLAEGFNGRWPSRPDSLRPIDYRLGAVRSKLGFVTLRWSPGSHRKLKFGVPSADALARSAVGLGKRR
jgi:ribonuclease HI